MFRRILVPVDGSTFAEHAIPYATKIAAASDAKLEFALVHLAYQLAMADTGVYDAFDEWEREHRDREAGYLRELVGRVATATGRAIDPILLSGDVVSVLEHEIEQRGVDLVVMTTHGRAGLERAWLGSVADALIRHVDAPVLLIRPNDGEPIDALGTAPPFAHVLIAVDGSARAERALAPATALARADSARVTLLRVVSPPRALSSPYLPHAIQLTRDELQQRENEARTYVEAKVQELRLGDADAAGEVLLDYHPARAVLRFADTHGVDLIGLGTHGHGPITRLVLGSVSDKVARAANVPVLVC
jgi:nucleotide-binding universal stress UspA family protein